MPRVESVEEFRDVGPGAYWVFTNAVWVRCPECGHGMVLALDADERGPNWHIVQSVPLTLEPAIHHLGCWAGWLIAGEWVRTKE